MIYENVSHKFEEKFANAYLSLTEEGSIFYKEILQTYKQNMDK